MKKLNKWYRYGKCGYSDSDILKSVQDKQRKGLYFLFSLAFTGLIICFLASLFSGDTKEHRYIKGYYCIKCNSKLGSYEVIYSDATCPYCGNMASSGTIIPHKVRARRYIKTAGWFNFWSKSRGYFEFADEVR